MNNSVLLVILDGWGIGENSNSNAIHVANTPVFDELDRKHSPAALYSSGVHVGLPPGQMGNSEVGHLNLGAGRVLLQELPKISAAIKDRSFFTNSRLLQAIGHSKKNNSSLHLIGLLSDGGVHSHQEHLFALLDLAKQQEAENVYIHAFLDGRDVPPRCAMTYIDQLNGKISSVGLGKIATITGRYYGMDRDNRWERVEQAYGAFFYGEGQRVSCAQEIIEKSYKEGISDEFVLPSIIGSEERDALIKEDDSCIFFNFRADRMRQIMRSFIEKDFSMFSRKTCISPYVVSFTEYEESFNIPVAFSSGSPERVLGEVISRHNVKQMRIAETEKYAHVTFFFNGGREEPFQGEERVLLPSPQVATYDQKPEMSSLAVTEEVIKALVSKTYGFILVNYANPDMVGHTGFFDASVKAVESVDTCVGKLIESALSVGSDLIITADHGNIETMKEPETGLPVTSHSTTSVPLYYITRKGVQLKKKGSLADVAPTVLALMGISKPSEMTGESLLK